MHCLHLLLGPTAKGGRGQHPSASLESALLGGQSGGEPSSAFTSPRVPSTARSGQHPRRRSRSSRSRSSHPRFPRSRSSGSRFYHSRPGSSPRSARAARLSTSTPLFQRWGGLALVYSRKTARLPRRLLCSCTTFLSPLAKGFVIIITYKLQECHPKTVKYVLCSFCKQQINVVRR